MEGKLEEVTCNVFGELFSSSAHFVQFFGIVCSAIIAIIAILANQWLVRRTARNQLMLSKLEAAYNHAVQLRTITLSLCNVENELLLLTHSHELSGLCALYFSNIEFKLDLFNTLYQSIGLNKAAPGLCELESEKDIIEQHLIKVHDDILSEITKYKH
jgi:hypothetical protein